MAAPNNTAQQLERKQMQLRDVAVAITNTALQVGRLPQTSLFQGTAILDMIHEIRDECRAELAEGSFLLRHERPSY